jgi:hypothetical protein
MATDLAVLLATWLVTREHGLPEGYIPIPLSALFAAQMALLAIYLSSTIVRTLLRGFTFGGFETIQCVLVFLLGFGGGLRLTSQDTRVGPALAILALVCAASCYVVVFRLLDITGRHGRSFYTYSTFGILLTVAGSSILLTGGPVAIAWGALAIVGAALPRLTLQVHGCVYLLLALGGSGALRQATGLLLGSRAWPGGEPWALGLGAAAAAICCLLGVRNGGWVGQALRTTKTAAAVLLIAGIVAGLLTSAITEFWARRRPTHTARRCVRQESSVLQFFWPGEGRMRFSSTRS